MGAIRNMWLKWKMLRLPWRKKFLVGQDLSGNTFWEFRDALNAGRMRRIVHQSPYAARGSHYADIPISPQWHQWLRQARLDAPSLVEQQQDVARQIQLKNNARLADERWAAKARYIEKPKPQARTMLTDDVRVTAGKDGLDSNTSSDTQQVLGDRSGSQTKDTVDVDDPWKSAKETSANPGGTYTPDTWSPASGKKR